MPLLRAVVKTCIVLFCLWHMAAVGTYALISTEGYPLLEWLEDQQDLFRPYVLITSQWQKWNLFSPDPLRRVTAAGIEVRRGHRWEEAVRIGPQTLPGRSREVELKILRRVLEKDRYDPIRKHYAHLVCRRHGTAPGTRVRLVEHYAVIPEHTELRSIEWWEDWQPQWRRRVRVESACPEPGGGETMGARKHRLPEYSSIRVFNSSASFPAPTAA